MQVWTYPGLGEGGALALVLYHHGVPVPAPHRPQAVGHVPGQRPATVSNLACGGRQSRPAGQVPNHGWQVVAVGVAVAEEEDPLVLSGESGGAAGGEAERGAVGAGGGGAVLAGGLAVAPAARHQRQHFTSAEHIR